MAGDFLTPIFLGFTFHDPFRFLPWQDRGTLLERSLEEQFRSLLKADQPKGPQPQGLPCIGDLECPFMSLRPTDGAFVDWIVDGGYFENLGAQTATELAEAIKAVDKRLKPFVLVISNDPHLEELKPSEKGSERRRDRLLLTDVSASITAFANTRTARGVLAVADVTAILDFHHLDVCNLAHIQVQGERDPSDPTRIRDLSWSWWLSKPVQIYLHEQTSTTKEGRLLKEINEAHIRYLLGAFKMPPPDDAVGSIGDGPKCSNE